MSPSIVCSGSRMSVVSLRRPQYMNSGISSYASLGCVGQLCALGRCQGRWPDPEPGPTPAACCFGDGVDGLNGMTGRPGRLIKGDCPGFA